MRLRMTRATLIRIRSPRTIECDENREMRSFLEHNFLWVHVSLSARNWKRNGREKKWSQGITGLESYV